MNKSWISGVDVAYRSETTKPRGVPDSSVESSNNVASGQADQDSQGRISNGERSVKSLFRALLLCFGAGMSMLLLAMLAFLLVPLLLLLFPVLVVTKAIKFASKDTREQES